MPMGEVLDRTNAASVSNRASMYGKISRLKLMLMASKHSFGRLVVHHCIMVEAETHRYVMFYNG